MAELSADFTKGALDATIALADVGDSSAFDVVDIIANGKFQYARIGEVPMARIEEPASGLGNIDCGWIASFGTQTDHYGCFLIHFAAFPPGLIVFFQVQSAGSLACRFYLNTSGKIIVGDQAGSGIGTTNTALVPGSIALVKYHIVHSATVGQCELKIHLSPDSVNPTETFTTAADKNFLASGDRVFFGNRNAWQASYVMHMGHIRSSLVGYPASLKPDSKKTDGQHARRADAQATYLARGYKASEVTKLTSRIPA